MDKIDMLRTMCDQQPKNVQLLYLLAMAYADEGFFQEARDTLGEAIPLAEPDLLPALMQAVTQIAQKSMAQSEDASEPKNDASAEFGSGGRAFRIVEGGKQEAPAAVSCRKQIRFADVGGLDDVKSAINMKIIQPFLHPELFEKFNKRSGGGVLLFGPPGCGKTYVAKATAGECDAQFLNVHITDILDKWIGESERNMENIFIKARSQKPCVVFIDEIDMLGFARAKSNNSSALRGVVDQLLTEMEGVESNNDGLLVVGATNMPWDVDSALKRPGRFDKTIFVPPPDAEARALIFQMQMEGKPCAEIDFEVLAKRCDLFSGADIAGVVELATEAVLEDIMRSGNEREIRQEDLLHAISRSKPSTLEWLRTISDFVRYSNQTGQYSEVEDFLKRYKGLI